MLVRNWFFYCLGGVNKTFKTFVNKTYFCHDWWGFSVHNVTGPLCVCLSCRVGKHQEKSSEAPPAVSTSISSISIKRKLDEPLPIVVKRKRGRPPLDRSLQQTAPPASNVTPASPPPAPSTPAQPHNTAANVAVAGRLIYLHCSHTNGQK